MSASTVTHVIASNLPQTKVKEWAKKGFGCLFACVFCLRFILVVSFWLFHFGCFILVVCGIESMHLINFSK